MGSKDVIPGVFSRHAGAYRDRLARALARGEAPGRLRVVESLGLRPGERVLDLGCGPGTLTLRLAAATGPGGLVLGVDLAPGMLALAAAGAPAWVRLARMDMERLAVRAGAFDAVACGHALQFCPDVAGALREARRALREGGRLAASVPAASGPSPAWQVIDEVLTAHAPAVPDLGDGDATRAVLRDEERASGALEAAGFAAVEIATVAERTRCAGPAELVASTFGWWSLAWRLEALSEAGRRRARDEALRRLRERLGDGPIELPGTTRVLSGVAA